MIAKRILYLTAASLVTCGASGQLAYAQSAPASGQTLDEVVVTARRTAENLQKVPVSVSAVSGEQLQQRGITEITQLQQVAPGLNIGSSGSGDRQMLAFSIRGQSLLFQQPNAAVITYMEEVPAQVYAQSVMYDLAGVQVLKGPQGTLFGKNTTGGAVLFSANKPTNSFEGEIAGRLGNYSMKQTDGYINVPIIQDKLMARVAFNLGKRDGFTHDITSGKDLDNENYAGLRLGLTYAPTDSIKNYLMVSLYNSSTNGTGHVLDSVNPAGIAGLFFPGIFPAFARQQQLGVRDVATSSDHFRKDHNYAVIDELTWDVTDNFSFRNIFGWTRQIDKIALDEDGTRLTILDWNAQGYPDDSQQTYSNELQARYNSKDDRLKVVAGYFGIWSEPYGSSAIYTVSLGAPAYRVSTFKTKSHSVYLQANYEVAPGLHLTGGIRYNKDTQQNFASIFGPAGQFAPPPTGCQVPAAPADCIVRRKTNFSHVSWLAGADYQITPDTMAYVVVRNGYRSGGLNGFIQVPQFVQYAPETVTDVEAGVKSQFHIGDAPARVNLDVFRGDYKKLQRATVIVSNGVVTTAFFNAADARVYGLELEAEIRPFAALDLSAFYNYTEPEYRGTLSPLLGLTPSFAYTPKTQVGATAVLSLPQDSHGGRPSLSATYSYQSSVSYSVTGPSTVPGYSLLNLRADWKGVMGAKVDLAAFANNVLDKEYRNFNSGFYNSIGYNVVTYGAPAMYGVEVRYHF